MLKDERMRCICDLVSTGGVVCDIGTDHAYIPVELVSVGKCHGAIITDISAPSLEKGLDNVRKNGLSHLISGFRANGTVGVPLEGVTDVMIAGMGGELIAGIIKQDSRLWNCAIRFILQPMSRAEELRRFLYTNGFETEREVRVRSDGRLYTVIVSYHTGKNTPCDTEAIYLGVNTEGTELDREYAAGVLRVLRAKSSGINRGEKTEDRILKIAELNERIASLEACIDREFKSGSRKNPCF